MKKSKIFIIIALIAMAAFPLAAGARSYSNIQSIDCDESSNALFNLIEDIQKGKVALSQRPPIATMLKNNIYKFSGDPEKCIIVNEDFIRVLSVDALGEFKSPSYKPTFIDLLGYLSQYQPGDIRQHAAMALAKMQAYDTVPALIRAIRDRRTFMTGYRESLETTAKPTIDESLTSERRDPRKDPYSYEILRALKSLARKKDYSLIKETILGEQRLVQERRSNWIGSISSDMIRIAAGLDQKDAFDLIVGQKNLSNMQKLRAFSFIRSDLIVPELSKIIKETAAPEDKDVPEELKLALAMLSSIKTRKSRDELTDLSKSMNQSVSFMALVYMSMLKKKDEEALKAIKAKIPFLPSGGLKIEAIKLFSVIDDRNAIPIIKEIYKEGNLKQKIYCIWALANLNVTDLKKDAEKLLSTLNPIDEANMGLDATNTLRKAIQRMETAKPAY